MKKVGFALWVAVLSLLLSATVSAQGSVSTGETQGDLIFWIVVMVLSAALLVFLTVTNRKGKG